MACHSGPNATSSHVVLHLDATNPRSYPGTGSIWYDLSGNANHTTIRYGTFTGRYFESVGANPDRLSFATPYSESLNNTFSVTQGGWSIEEVIWIKDANYPEAAAGTMVGQSGYGSGHVGFDWNHGEQNAQHVEFGASNNIGQPAGYDVRSTVTVDPSISGFEKWMYRSMYWDRTNNTIGLYVNGAFQGSISSAAVAGQPLWVGGTIQWGELYGWMHDGYRASMKVYNKVLSADEVSSNYNAFRDRFGI